MLLENQEKKSYTYQEVYDETLKYFSGDTLATDVWIKKYCLKNSVGNLYEKTPDDMHQRIAKELARIENKYPNPINEEEIYKTLKNFERIIPQGSPMAGIGNNLQVSSLSNCYVIGNEKDSDSYGGILRIDQNMVNLMKRRGGVGTDLSFIRPTGSPVKNTALNSTGVVPFMERYSNSTKEVAQDSRRGALMLSISIKHPDSENFIDAKLAQGKVTGANISVKLTDNFLESALNNQEFTQQFPINSENPKFIKAIDANKLWKKIIHNAWKSAEPGLLFWDTILRESIPDCYSDFGFETKSTNPCLPKWINVLTKKGIRKLDDVSIDDEIWSESGWTKIINKWSTGIKKVYKYCTTFGIFYSTENHEIISKDVKIEIKDALGIDVLRGESKNNMKHNSHFIMDGIVFGDGSVHKASNNLLYLCVGEDDYDYFDSEIKDLIRKKRDGLGPYAYEIYTNLDASEVVKTYDRKIPDRYVYGTFEEKCSFLRGLYTANGSIVSSRITLKSASKTLIDQVQLMLSSIGIVSYITTNKTKKVKFSNGEYQCKESYDLNITSDVEKFYSLVGFIQKYKIEKVKNIILTRTRESNFNKTKKIISSEFFSEEEVFDISVDNESHTFWCNGFNVKNCGEIPLCNFDSCRLLLLNLYGYVKNPFEINSYFDFELFKKDVRIAQRYMDDIVDLELEKIDAILEKIKSDPEDEFIKLYEIDLWNQIKKMTELGRRTGLGITAEGDMLAALGFRYGTDEATEFSIKVHKLLKLTAYRSSVEMAKERGAFPIYDCLKETNNPFIKRIADEDYDLYIDMITFGRRNIALLTISPAGTTSLMTQTTSGIEPVFLPLYMRRRKINPNEINVRIDFSDEEGIKWTEYPVFHHKFAIWLEKNGYNVEEIKLMNKENLDKIIEKSPYYKATSNDLDWVKKVEMQGMIQKEIDHSISVTINIPKDITEETVSKIYEMGWKSGCKGITIYRDGSRDGVLNSINEKKKEEIINDKFKDNDAPKRPKRLDGEIMRFQNNSEKWIAVVGLLDGRPYELFTGKLENGLSKLPQYVTKCKIVRQKTEEGSRYDIEYMDNDGKEQTSTGLSHKFDPSYWNYTKMISGVLRHGMPLPYVYNLIESLNLKDDNLNTWKNGISRIIKKYIKDGEKLKGKCHQCGSENLEFKEGCVICSGCGSSKCG